MRWLKNNLPGAILLVACGLLVVVSVLMALSWSKPVSPGEVAVPEEATGADENAKRLADLGPLGQYRVVTDRPLFNETRRPVLDIEVAEEPEVVQHEETVADAPKVNLTGVVITPDARLVSLTPQGGGEPLMFREGWPMRGEYNGWLVSEIHPRRVLLESTNGSTLELDLLVHDEKIKEPPKPVKPAAEPENEQAPDEGLGEERLSRAEEIRQRIAERREQLRREAAEKQQASGAQQPKSYKEAIQGLMNSQPRDKNEEGDEDV